MAGTLFFPPNLTAFDDNGLAEAGAKLYFYEAGTENPQAAYLDVALTTPVSVPLVADSAGRFPPVYLDSEKSYKTVLNRANDTLIDESDPYVGSGGGGSGDTEYNTVALLEASTEDARGTGEFWKAGPFRYKEVTSGNETITNAASTPVPLKYEADLRKFPTSAYGITGTSDDTDAFKKLVADVNAAGGGHIIIETDVRLDETGAPEAVNIEFTDCNGLILEGQNGSVLIHKGDFEHSSSITSTSLIMRRCNDVRLLNVRTDGQARLGTKSGSEQGEHGLQMFGCKRVVFENCDFYSHPNDGLYIDHIFSSGAISVSSEQIVLINTQCRNNARQGMSLIGVFNFAAYASRFIDTGKTGAFGSYAPGAGVDIEPNTVGVLCVSGASFYDCYFTGNIGSQFVTVGEASDSFDGRVNDVWLYNPVIETESNATTTDQVILAVQRGGIKGGVVDLTGGTGLVTPRIVPVYSTYNSNVTIDNVEIISNTEMILATLGSGKNRDQQRVNIMNCRLISRETSATGYYRPQINCGGCFINNDLFIPTEAYAPGNANRIFVHLKNLHKVSGNTYRTDMTTANQAFNIDYDGTLSIENETFESTTAWATQNNRNEAAGTAPSSGSYKVGDEVINTSASAEGDIASWICTDASGPTFAVKSRLSGWQTRSATLPTTGTYALGDIVWNTSANALNDVIFWVCTQVSPLEFRDGPVLGAVST